MDGLGCPFRSNHFGAFSEIPSMSLANGARRFWASSIRAVALTYRSRSGLGREKNINLLENTRGLYSRHAIWHLPTEQHSCSSLEMHGPRGERNLPDNKSDMTTPFSAARKLRKRPETAWDLHACSANPWCCRRYSIQADMLESAVIGALLDLAESEELPAGFTSMRPRCY